MQFCIHSISWIWQLAATFVRVTALFLYFQVHFATADELTLAGLRQHLLFTLNFTKKYDEIEPEHSLRQPPTAGFRI